MLTHSKLKGIYSKRKSEVKKRLKEFSNNRKYMGDKDLFVELCFCLCTPQSKAVKVAEVIHKDNATKLLTLNQDQMAQFLCKNTRFHNNKSKHIIHARQFATNLKNLPKESFAAREFLVKNIKGLGYKEASHYLRNIGYRDLCIIDRHVINLMHELRVFENDKPPTTPKRYIEMENIIKDYAKSYDYDVDELDLVLWSIKTGHVFK